MTNYLKLAKSTRIRADPLDPHAHRGADEILIAALHEHRFGLSWAQRIIGTCEIQLMYFSRTHAIEFAHWSYRDYRNQPISVTVGNCLSGELLFRAFEFHFSPLICLDRK